MVEARNKGQTGPKGLAREAMVQEAVALMEETGEAGFSLRKLATRLGCDPMAVLYHYKSKEGLYRAMADQLTTRLQAVDAHLSWQARLSHLAAQYRQLALLCPHTFLLMQRFLNTGRADFSHIEMVWQALRDAGLPDDALAAHCLGWYATVIGLAAAQVQGLIRPATTEEQAEIRQLASTNYPLLSQAANALGSLDAMQVQIMTLDMLHEGIRLRAASCQGT